MAGANFVLGLARLIWGDWQANDLWQRILKYSIACTAALIVAVHPAVVSVFGTATFLTVQAVVFAHPGQRMGLMIESLLMVVAGAMTGLGWSLLGLHLSSLVFDKNEQAGYTIRALFLLVVVMSHGFIRSASPRLFVFVLIMLVASAQVLLGKSAVVTQAVFTNVAYPILAGAAILLVVNLGIFPELSSSFLGSSVIDTLSQTMDTLNRATHWFITPGGDQQPAEHDTELDPALTRLQSVAPLKQEKPRNKSRWQRFLANFPNPFQKAKNQFPASLVPPALTKLASLTDRKTKLRTQMLKCKTAQNEVNFEISVSPLPPMSMKPISTHCMTSLVQNTITLIGACENKFVVLGAQDPLPADSQSDSLEEGEKEDGSLSPISEKGNDETEPTSKRQPNAAWFWQHVAGRALEVDAGLNDESHLKRVEEVKPLRELHASNAELLESILTALREPVQDFSKSLQEAVALLTSCLAYCFDVAHLPSGAPTPKGIQLEEIDLRVDMFASALTRFDARTQEELRLAATSHSKKGNDLMPRMEMFLVSSFLLGFRQAATQIMQMLRHARGLVEQRRQRRDQLRVWFPQYESIKQWLSTGGESDVMVLPDSAKKSIRTGKRENAGPLADEQDSHMDGGSLPGQRADEEAPAAKLDNGHGEHPASTKQPLDCRRGRRRQKPSRQGWFMRLRASTADGMEWALGSDDLAYAIKLSIAMFLVTWPAFVSSWNEWYAEIRGIWAPLQLVLVFEVVIGSSFFIFFIRLFGVFFGCGFGLLSYAIGQGNRAAMVAVLVFGVVPSVYIQLATKYVKAGMVSIISLTVVSLATVNLGGTAVENFYTRLGAFVIGGSVAMLVEVVIYPVRARDRLVECLSSSVKQIQNMQAVLSVGIDNPAKPNFRSRKVNARFIRARDKAQAALGAAETFLPFCLTEPRIKGSFRKLLPIYREIIYVLHQIIDRMDNSVQLRQDYGSSMLEDLNPDVFAYRRNVAAGAMLTLFSVHEALTTWLPLPQFIPSVRLAQNRLVNRIRDVLESQTYREAELVRGGEVDEHTARVITQRKFLSWNASAAGQMEIIEYLEELIELTKLLVGVNAFRSGILEKPNYRQYVDEIASAEAALDTARSPDDGLTSAAAAATPLGRVTSLSKAVAVARGVDKFKGRIKKTRSTSGGHGQREAEPPPPQTSRTAAVDIGDDEAVESEPEQLPRSLQRVGSRLRRESTVMRRRGFTVGGPST